MESCLITLPEHKDYNGIYLELWDTVEDAIKIRNLLEQVEFSATDKIVVICLAASDMKKCWPISNYNKCIQKLNEIMDLKFVILGETLEQGELSNDDCCIVDFRMKLTLRETVALLRRTTLFIGNDTGLMHIAVAVGCKVVEISSFARYGDAASGFSTARFSPWSKDALIVQPVHQLAPCKSMCQMPYAHCITQVTVDAVLEAAGRLLKIKGTDVE